MAHANIHDFSKIEFFSVETSHKTGKRFYQMQVGCNRVRITKSRFAELLYQQSLSDFKLKAFFKSTSQFSKSEYYRADLLPANF